jgi:hypothetical protein
MSRKKMDALFWRRFRMRQRNEKKLWTEFQMTRREFLRSFGIASGAITLSPLFIDRFSQAIAQVPSRVKVYLVKNGDFMQNISRVWDLSGLDSSIEKDDHVVIKGNGQWPHQGYTHTGCIKAFVDKTLSLPGYTGEVLICDNVQEYGGIGATGFDASVENRVNNWPNHNWNSLAAEYRGQGHRVAAVRWISSPNTGGGISGPANGSGWVRRFFSFYGANTFLSYPIFESPLTPGRLFDMKNGVWEGGPSGGYTGRRVRTIFMPTLNYHSNYAGITSAIKSYYGATEIHFQDGTVTHNGQTWYNIHSVLGASWTSSYRSGELVARFINEMYSPILHITCAIYTGHLGRTSPNAVQSNAVLACTNPATLDFVSCRDIANPARLSAQQSNILDPEANTRTRDQILGCIQGGVGTINPNEYEIVSYDFNNPSVHRIDVDRKIRDFKAGIATEGEVKNLIESYMEGS